MPTARNASARCFSPSSMRRVMRKSRGFDRMREQLGPYRSTDAVSRDESCSRLVHRVQPELPHPIKAAQVAQHERAIGFEDGHRPAWRLSERNNVANRELLKFRENARGAGTIEVAEESIEPLVAVQPATLDIRSALTTARYA